MTDIGISEDRLRHACKKLGGTAACRPTEIGSDNGRLSEIIVAPLPRPLYPRKLPRHSLTGVSALGHVWTAPWQELF
jgi:hypothetical protein